MRRIIIDCDPGLDDLVALALVNTLDNTELLGITTVSGNQTVEVCTKNALEINEFFHLNVPVHKGAVQPIYRKQQIADEIHGTSGVGNVKLPKTEKLQSDIPAHKFLIDASKKYKEELDIVAVGPLTNIALAILNDPGFAKRVRSITLMGGGHQHGNVTPAAEFNIYADPDAAKIVFESAANITVLPLDATMSEGLSEEDISTITKNIKSNQGLALKTALIDILNIGRKFNNEFAFLHDPIALLALTEKDFISGKEYRVDIETKGQLTLGKTVVDLYNTTKREPNVFFANHYDKKILLKKLNEMMLYYEKL